MLPRGFVMPGGCGVNLSPYSNAKQTDIGKASFRAVGTCLAPGGAAASFARVFAKIYDQPTHASSGSTANQLRATAPGGSRRRRWPLHWSPPPRPSRRLIRDAETEALIRTYAKPIFDAAGLGSQGIRIHIVNNRIFNAFVVDGHNMFSMPAR